MVTINLGNVQANTVFNATTRSCQRKMFRNPRGLQRFYVFYLDDSPKAAHYAWSADGYSAWTADLPALVTTDIQSIAAVFVEDPLNAQTVVYVAGEIPDGNVYLNRGVIPDAASLIAWDGEAEAFNTDWEVGTFNLCIDDNDYLWVGALYDVGGAPGYEVKASTIPIPTTPIAWTGSTDLGTGVDQVAMVAYGNGIVCIGFDGTTLWACYSQYGNPPTDEGEDIAILYPGAVAGAAVRDDSNIIHFVYAYGASGVTLVFQHRSWNPATKAWTGESGIYNGQDNTRDPPLLVCDTSRTPNYLYAIYEHGTGEIEYKTSPSNAIAWSAAAVIEDHAEDCRYLVGWYEDDPVDAGAIFGAFVTQTTDTVRTFVLTIAAPAGVAYTDVKASGWWKGVRGKKFFLDGETFVGQDTRRWGYVADDTGFLWDAQGQLTIPADRAMTSAESYAYCILTAIVHSADISDCRIGFYADANHYCWIDQDSFRCRNGITAETTTAINWLDNTHYKIILIWTPFIAYLEIWTPAGELQWSGKLYNPPQLESHVTFQVIAAGSDLLVEDYALFDAEVDVIYKYLFEKEYEQKAIIHVA